MIGLDAKRVSWLAGFDGPYSSCRSDGSTCPLYKKQRIQIRVVPPVLFRTNYYSIEILHGVTAIILTYSNNVKIFSWFKIWWCFEHIEQVFCWFRWKNFHEIYVTRSIVMRNVPQCMFPRNRLLKFLHREKSHKIWFLVKGKESWK